MVELSLRIIGLGIFYVTSQDSNLVVEMISKVESIELPYSELKIIIIKTLFRSSDDLSRLLKINPISFTFDTILKNIPPSLDHKKSLLNRSLF